ncbi:MAG: 2,3-bisphosphoglycerate-independent phosphoglycerate mutase [Rhizomicrobium sp.]
MSSAAPHLSRPHPAVLCILDGWGWRPDPTDNAIAEAKTPNYTRLLAECPHALLATSGHAVGLPAGQMGNSEVGHMNIGAGRVVSQDLPRIDLAIEDGSFAQRPALLDIIAKAKASEGAVHVMGLLSPGGVHSHQDHIAALVRVLSGAGVPVFVHAFLDGRDVPPKSALGFLKTFADAVAGLAGVRLATASGRYYAMDRDKRWERVVRAYDAMVDAKGTKFPDAYSAVEESYGQGVTDEFVLPCVIGDYAGMADGDALIFANFRADRGARDFPGAARSGLHRLRAPPCRPVFGGRRHDGIFRRAERPDDSTFPGRGHHRHAGRDRRGARPEAASHRRDGEIRPCHLLPERRARDGFSGRGPHPGA